MFPLASELSFFKWLKSRCGIKDCFRLHGSSRLHMWNGMWDKRLRRFCFTSCYIGFHIMQVHTTKLHCMYLVSRRIVCNWLWTLHVNVSFIINEYIYLYMNTLFLTFVLGVKWERVMAQAQDIPEPLNTIGKIQQTGTTKKLVRSYGV